MEFVVDLKKRLSTSTGAAVRPTKGDQTWRILRDETLTGGPAPPVPHVGALAADVVELPVVFDASGGGARLSDDGSMLVGTESAWATLGGLVDRGVLVWRFRVGSDFMAYGLITGADPVPADWLTLGNARGYGIVTTSSGWVDVLGKTMYGSPANWRMTPRDSDVECTLDMDARTLSFTVNGSTPPCVAFTDIEGPVRAIVWSGNAKLLRVAGKRGHLAQHLRSPRFTAAV